MPNWKDGYGTFDKEGMSTGKRMTPRQRRRFKRKTMRNSKIKLPEGEKK